MPITTKPTASLAATSLLLLTMVVSTSAYAVGIPNSVVPLSGAPFMFHSVKVRANRGSWTVSSNTGNDDFQFFDGSMLYDGTGSKYTLKANFNRNTGAFEDGTLNITGKIPSLSSAKTTLVTADITAFDFNALYDNKLVGFRTDNIVCNSLLGIACATNEESVWLILDAVFGGDTTAKFKNSGSAITTLPLPAAVWLFGSGLVFLGATGRRRSAASKKSDKHLI